jgi:hypothetical protein
MPLKMVLDAPLLRFNYNDEHLPDVINSGGTTLGLRYKNTKLVTETDMPYLAIYPVDTQWLGSPEHKHLITSTKRSPAMQTEDRMSW